jgi:hypothetical protein
MTTETAMPRPGCFGSPTCFTPIGLPCTSCPFKEDCGEISERVAMALRAKYGIAELIGARGRPKGDKA